jgi:hypothetical protein
MAFAHGGACGRRLLSRTGTDGSSEGACHDPKIWCPWAGRQPARPCSQRPPPAPPQRRQSSMPTSLRCGRRVLETPSAQNSFGTGGAPFGCWNLGGGTVAPFGPGNVPSCTVKPGTKILVAASSVECSMFEGNGTTEAELRACAEQKEGDEETSPMTMRSSDATDGASTTGLAVGAFRQHR